MSILVVLLGFAGMLVAGCMGDADRQTGVISTENAGRISGTLAFSDQSVSSATAELRLLSLDDSIPRLVKQTVADSTGGYAFDDIPPGKYRVDAVLTDGLSGSSSVFEVQSNKTSDVVVVVVVARSFQFILVPGSGDRVAKVWVGDPGREAEKIGQSWSIPVIPGSDIDVGAVVVRGSGKEETILYRLEWKSGKLELVPVSMESDAPKVDSSALRPSKSDSLVAHWVIASDTSLNLVDSSGNGFELSKMSDGVWGHANDTFLTQKVTGQILFQARVWLDEYPSSDLQSGRAVVMGFYEGPKMLVNNRGQLQIGGQRGDGNWNWFAPESKAGIVPLGRWVDLAVGADSRSGDFYAWVDGKAVATWGGAPVAGSMLRVPMTEFVLGADARDGQKFPGRISEVKIWNKFVLGEGIPSGVDPCIDPLSGCAEP